MSTEAPTSTKFTVGQRVVFHPRNRTRYGRALPGYIGWREHCRILSRHVQGGYVLSYEGTKGTFSYAYDFDLSKA